MSDEQNTGFFPITSIHRDDVIQALMDESQIGVRKATKLAKSLTDDDMRIIAEKMGEAYVSNGYWMDLDYLANEVLEDKEKTNEHDR